MVLEPGNPNNLLVTPAGTMLFGGVYRSTNALAPTPTFSQTLNLGSSGRVMKLAINKVGATVTVYVDSSEPSGVPACSGAGQAGRLRKSTDAGVTWSVPLVAAEGYCGGQCVYDNPVAVDPNNANIVYLGGNARGVCSDAMKLSTDGGATFIRDDTGLHADVQDIFIDGNSVPSTVWSGSDGGIWKRQGATAGAAWSNLNNAPLGTLQFQSLAVHPTDQFFTIGGTQDNGTEAQTGSNGNWSSAESGDGGFALIDQSATNTTAVTMYHTFFNQTGNFIGFDRTNLGACLNTKDSWEWRGAGIGPDSTPACDGTPFADNNGISVTDTVLFYAPMALGPGTPNTLYFGTDRLYRSTNRGDSMFVVSQDPIIAAVPISAIGIDRTNDNVRIVGLRNGSVFATTTGANPLVNTAFPIPANATASTTNRYVSRTVIDPTNLNTAYVTLSYYTNPSTDGKIWRTTNLSGAPPTWTAIGSTGNGLPDIPVNAFVVDANDATHPGVSVLYAGSDIGVYTSTDSGATWGPFGIGLPRVAVFDMAIQPTSRILRIATHGRGMWEIGLPSPLQLTAAASRKKHGTGGLGTNFDISMPFSATLFSGTSGVEDRNGGDSDGGGTGTYKIVFTFNNPVVFGDATVTAHNPVSGTGTAGGASGSGNEMTIPLTGVSNGQVLTVTATGVTDGTNTLPPFDVNIGFLIGDTTASRSVNSSDIGQTKSRSGQTTNSINFRSDVTVSGSINASDIGLVKSKSGTSMP